MKSQRFLFASMFSAFFIVVSLSTSAYLYSELTQLRVINSELTRDLRSIRKQKLNANDALKRQRSLRKESEQHFQTLADDLIPDCTKHDRFKGNSLFSPKLPYFIKEGTPLTPYKLTGTGERSVTVISPPLPQGLEYDHKEMSLKGTPVKPTPLRYYQVTSIVKSDGGICALNFDIHLGVYPASEQAPQSNELFTLGAVFSDRGKNEARFQLPYGSEIITNDRGEEELLITDCAINEITRLSLDGLPLSTWGKKGTSLGELNTPADIKLSNDNRVFVVEERNHRVQVFDVNGNAKNVFGAYGQAGGDSRTDNGYFNNPLSIAFFKDDKFAVSDHGNHRIQLFSADGSFLTRWGKDAGAGTPGTAKGEFTGPYYMSTDDSDHLYVVDRGNHRVQKFHKDGSFITMWGHRGGDGTKSDLPGAFNWPHEIAIDQ